MIRELLLELYKKYGDDLLMSTQHEFSIMPEYNIDFKFKEEFCVFTIRLKDHTFSSSSHNGGSLTIEEIKFNVLPHSVRLEINHPSLSYELNSVFIPRYNNDDYDITNTRGDKYLSKDILIYSRIYSTWYSHKTFKLESYYNLVPPIIDEIREIVRRQSDKVNLSSDIWLGINLRNRFLPISKVIFPQKGVNYA